MKTILAFLALVLSLAAQEPLAPLVPLVSDDGNAETGRARFSWEQDPDPIIHHYWVTIWKEGQTVEQGIRIMVPRPAELVDGMIKTEVIIDGFVRGTNYRTHVRAVADGDADYSDPSEVLSFRYMLAVPQPGKPKVETLKVEVLSINESNDLQEWRTLAYIPAKQGDKLFVRLGKATAEEQ